jgi:hypothetical protein
MTSQGLRDPTVQGVAIAAVNACVLLDLTWNNSEGQH